MVDPFQQVLDIIESLNQAEVDYVVIGGVALNLHGIVRATEDLDLFLRPTHENIHRLRQALRAIWDDPEIDAITAEDLCGDYPAVRYGPPEGTLYLDLLTRLGEQTSFEDIEVMSLELDGVPVRVVSPRGLYRLKKDTVRPIDQADAQALRAAFGLEEGQQ